MTTRSDLRITADDVLAGRGRGHDDPQVLWRTIVELGWPLVGIREEVGGAGGSLDDLLELATAIGYATADVPFAPSAIGSWVAAESGEPELVEQPPVVDVVSHGMPTVELAAGLVTGDVRGLTAPEYPRWLVVYAHTNPSEPLMLDLDAPGVRVDARRTLAGETRLDVALHAVPARALPTAPPRLALARRATLLRLALTMGTVDRAVDLTVAHVRVREQFGRTLARLPMVQAQVASMAIAATAAHSAMNAAIAGDATDTWAAAVVVRRSAEEVAATAHQLLGALGTTLEHDLHRATRRIWAWRDDATTAKQAAGRLGEQVLSERTSMWGLCAG